MKDSMTALVFTLTSTTSNGTGYGFYFFNIRHLLKCFDFWKQDITRVSYRMKIRKVLFVSSEQAVWKGIQQFVFKGVICLCGKGF